ERDEDPKGIWRHYVNDQLDGPYKALFARLHDLILLEAPSFEVVAGWRAEQEAKLLAQGKGGMAETEIARFVAHYERLTRWILAEMPGRADWVVTLDTERNPYA
ncbi:MAG: kinase, partial [Phenylobacterium sp.]